MNDRRAVLQRLLDLAGPIADISRELRAFPWDSDEELVTLTADHVAGVLRRYLAGDLSEAEVEDWADALEVRDDVRFDDSAEEGVLAAVHFLANPYLHGPLTPEEARAWLDRLRK